MNDFVKAQILFKEYENNGQVASLEDALEILDGIVKRQKPNSQQAINLKKTISKYLDIQINDIYTRCNLGEYSNNLKNGDDLISFLNGSLNKEEAIKFIQLVSMQIKYYKGDR